MRGVAVVLAALLLAGCSGGTTLPSPGPAQIDVDTTELRQMKADAGVEPCRPGDGDPVAGGLPAITLPCLGGGDDVDLSTLRGPMVVNLWASWCGPCREEMPVIQQFYEKHGDRVQVLGIDYEDRQVGGAMTLVEESGVTYPQLADPQSALQGAGPFPGLMALPMFVFVDEDGEATVVAEQVDSVDELEGLVDETLGIRL